MSLDGRPLTKASQPVGEDDLLEVADDTWVSRAAHKLLGALDDLGIEPTGRALDIGASTGGFTQVLRQRGCEPVYAIDVGHGQLDHRLRADPGVIVREGLNARDLSLDQMDGRPVDIVVADVSFISLTLLVAPVSTALRPGGTALLIVKPQFEVGRERLGKGGVVRDERQRRDAVEAVIRAGAAVGLQATGQVPSRLPGPAGNVEYFVAFSRAG